MDLSEQKLVALKNSRQESIQAFFIERFSWLRKINKYEKNFLHFKISWKEVVEKNTMEKIMQIAKAVDSFFVAFPYYVETRRQVALLYVAVWKGNSDLCKNIIKNNAKNYF